MAKKRRSTELESRAREKLRDLQVGEGTSEMQKHYHFVRGKGWQIVRNRPKMRIKKAERKRLTIKKFAGEEDEDNAKR